MAFTYDSKRAAARANTSTRQADDTTHPLFALQRAVGNHAVATALTRATEGSTEQAAVGSVPVGSNAERNASHEQSLREEIAGALNVPADNARVDAALFGDFEIARALKEARQLDQAATTPMAEKPQQTEIREDPLKGLSIEQRERKIHEDAVKEELSRLGITDEMILNGYRRETPIEFGNVRGRIVDQWIPDGVYGRCVHIFEMERNGKTDRVVTTTDFAKGGEKTTVRTTIEDGQESSVTTMEPGYGKLGERAALEKTTTRWVRNPDGTVMVETLDKYGRPIPGRSWKPDVLKLR